jgi:hypothetical protein
MEAGFPRLEPREFEVADGDVLPSRIFWAGRVCGTRSVCARLSSLSVAILVSTESSPVLKWTHRHARY